MSKAASIEDLLKSSAAGAKAPSGSPAVPVPNSAGASRANALGVSQATTKVAATLGSNANAEQLAGKMDEIKLREKERLTQMHAKELGMPSIVLRGFAIAPEALSLLPRAVSTANSVVAFLHVGSQIRLGTTDVTDGVKEIQRTLTEDQHAQVELYLISEDSLRVAQKMYDILPTPKEVTYGYRINEADLERYESQISNFSDLQEQIKKVSTTDIITIMIGAALKSNVSDIHVEAEEEAVKIRFRLDGLLHDAAVLPRTAWQHMIGRIKLLSGVKINIEDVPQDGRITIYLPSEKVDIRVSFLPTAFGESVVMRLLRPKAVALEFENLGIRGLALERLQAEIARPNGMIVTTGPTGSGKTTTLYAVLKKLNEPDVKIITLEDPIEYKLVGINQSQIEHSKNYDFAKGLRSILRQDPDIVMVGEIRDLETAEISIQAALTGHLVVSTIHTNSAAGAVPRFLSMGVKAFLLAPALNAVIGQRLVRRLCKDCAVEAELSPSQLTEVTRILKAIPASSGTIVDLSKLTFKGPGKGCATCNNLRYKGRVGIYEIFTMNKEIEAAILEQEVSEYKILELALKNGMVTMAQDGLLKALEGLTSVDEVLAVANTDTLIAEPELAPVPSTTVAEPTTEILPGKAP
ncbi:type II/IV secretion system protein [Patescibacteria group bacterium]|nr:type II/IV secretion system protein [Patescibacteria group bacterium]